MKSSGEKPMRHRLSVKRPSSIPSSPSARRSSSGSKGSKASPPAPARVLSLGPRPVDEDVLPGRGEVALAACLEDGAVGVEVDLPVVILVAIGKHGGHRPER